MIWDGYVLSYFDMKTIKETIRIPYYGIFNLVNWLDWDKLFILSVKDFVINLKFERKNFNEGDGMFCFDIDIVEPFAVCFILSEFSALFKL